MTVEPSAYLPWRNSRELFVIELTRFEYVPGAGAQSLTWDKSPASISDTFSDSRTTLEEAVEVQQGK